MKNRELIAKLAELPLDWEVQVYDHGSDTYVPIDCIETECIVPETIQLGFKI